jgi:hypothetical protein
MKSLNRLISYVVGRVTLVALFSVVGADSALSQADFYNGKTITIIRGGGPGGSGEFQTRSLCAFSENIYPVDRALRFNIWKVPLGERPQTSFTVLPDQTD